MSPTPTPRTPARRACVINTHLHFDHCGGNASSRACADPRPGTRARPSACVDDYTIREWVDFDGGRMSARERGWSCYRESPPARRPGTDGHQVVVVRDGAGTKVLGRRRGRMVRRARQRTTEDSVACSRSERRRGSPTRRGRDPRTTPVGDGPPPATVPGVHLDRGG